MEVYWASPVPSLPFTEPVKIQCVCPPRVYLNAVPKVGYCSLEDSHTAKFNTCCCHSFSNWKMHHVTKCIWFQCPHRPLCTWKLITCENSNLKTKSSWSNIRAEKQGIALSSFKTLCFLFLFLFISSPLLILSWIILLPGLQTHYVAFQLWLNFYSKS